MRASPVVTATASLTLWLLQIAIVAAGVLVAISEVGFRGQWSTVCDLVGAGILAWGQLTPFSLAVALLVAPPGVDAVRGAQHSRPFRRQAAILAVLVGYGAALLWLSSSTKAAPSAIATGAAAGFTAGVGVLVLATRAMWAALRELPGAVVRRSVAIVVGTMAVGVAANVLTYAPISLALLERSTLHAVDAVLRLLYSDVATDLASRRVGTSAFRVRVETGCSGIEGISLGLVVAGFYLWLGRDRLRFPRALLLLPAVAVAVASVNIVRIVSLIVAGQHSPALAVGGFHSGIGWFLFAVTTASVIPALEGGLSLRAPAPPRADVVADAPLPFLLPFIVLLAASVVITMLGLRDTPWAQLRYAAAGVAVALMWRRLPRMTIPRSPLPWLAGALLAVPWVTSSANAQVAPVLAAMDPRWFAAKAAGFVLVTPLVEEIAFRGYLLRRLVSARFTAVRLRDTSWWAVIVSSLLFGATHGMWVEATVAGAVFALIARRFDAIGPAIIAHACANALLLAYAVATGDFAVVG